MLIIDIDPDMNDVFVVDGRWIQWEDKWLHPDHFTLFSFYLGSVDRLGIIFEFDVSFFILIIF